MNEKKAKEKVKECKKDHYYNDPDYWKAIGYLEAIEKAELVIKVLDKLALHDSGKKCWCRKPSQALKNHEDNCNDMLKTLAKWEKEK